MTPHRPRLSAVATSLAFCSALLVTARAAVAPPSPSAGGALADVARVWCARNPDAVSEAADVLNLRPPLPDIARTVPYDEFIKLIEQDEIVSIYLAGSDLLGVTPLADGQRFRPPVIRGELPGGAHNLLADISTAAAKAGTPNATLWLEEVPFMAMSEADSARACAAAFEAADHMLVRPTYLPSGLIGA